MAQYSATDCALPPEMLEIITPRAVAFRERQRDRAGAVDRDRAHARRGRKKIVRQLAAPDEAVGFAREAPDRLGIAIRCADDLHRAGKAFHACRRDGIDDQDAVHQLMLTTNGQESAGRRLICGISCGRLLHCSALCLFVQLRTLMHYFT